MSIDLDKAQEICKKYKGRRIYNAGCMTVAEMVDGDFREVAHPEEYIWCEVLPDVVNLFPEAIAEIAELRAKIRVLEGDKR